jgi:hypothetical protein
MTMRGLAGALAICAAAIWAGSKAAADEHKRGGAHANPHVLLTPDDVKWGPGPASLPPGANAVVIEGDPTKPGLFTLRLKLPADYKVMPHWHPADEHVTVISSTFNMGMANKFDTSNKKALPTKSFAVMPARAHHFAWTTEETVIQLHGQGPWGINYVDPANDPRKATAAGK